MVKSRKKLPSAVNDSPFQPRPPVVAVLGHIDHGKTTLLDFIRQTHMAEKEAGGITQHIGAYQAKVKVDQREKLITFIDTPGHEAFSQMRSRGAQAADIALLIISAKDGVMPQTKESIAYIKGAKIPVVIAINKIDVFANKAERNVALQKIQTQLKNLEMVVEKEGGEIVCLPISAKTGENVSQLLEMIALIAEMNEIKVKKEADFLGVIIDSQIDPRQGVLATVLVKEGSLNLGDEIEVEGIRGRVRALFDERGKRVKKAGPAKPVQVLGLAIAPPVGGMATLKALKKTESTENSVPSEKLSAFSVAKKTSENRLHLEDTNKLRMILKTDTLGTKEAVLAALKDRVEIIFSGIGDISQSDVFLAKTVKAPILGFKVNLPLAIQKLAQNEKVRIKTYEVIYRLLEEIDELIEFLKQKKEEKVLGRAKILAEFEIDKKKIAGAKVFEGRIARGDKIKILRGEEEIGQARIVSLHCGKKDFNKVEKGKECGIGFSKKLDFEVGDIVKSIG